MSLFPLRYIVETGHIRTRVVNFHTIKGILANLTVSSNEQSPFINLKHKNINKTINPQKYDITKYT